MLTEAARLRALESYGVLDTPPEPELDELARAAALACGVPVALVSLVDRERQFFKARVGVELVEAPRPGSFCEQAIARSDLLEVPDASLDPRFNGHPLVKGEPYIRFYAGAPLIDASQAAIGTLCVLDFRPRRLARDQADALRGLARQVMGALERRKCAIAMRRLREALDADLRQTLQRLARHVGKLRGPPRDLFGAIETTDAALQLVDDAVDAVDLSAGIHLCRREIDLAATCGELAVALRGSGRVVLSVMGSCAGFWDPDRLTQALGTLLDDAVAGAGGEMVRFSVNGTGGKMVIEIRTPSMPDGVALRRDLATAIIHAHGGQVESGRDLGQVSLVLSLPRGQD